MVKMPWWTWYKILPSGDPAMVTLKIRFWHPLLWWHAMWSVLRRMRRWQWWGDDGD